MSTLNLPQAIQKHKQLQHNIVGAVYSTKYSGNIKILDYKDKNHVYIEFVTTHNTKWVSLCNIRRGEVGDTEDTLITPHVYKVGFIGIGKYSKKHHKKIYDAWIAMLSRCYDKKVIALNPTYQGCSVCEEWHNFQNFAVWFEKHCKCDKPQIDKDIRVKGNKLYSPDTCCVLPNVINKCFVKRQRYRGEYPIGVVKGKGSGFVAKLGNIWGFKKYLGYFSTVDKAFYAYKQAKEQLIIFLAHKFKEQLDDIAYQALLNYQVEITD